MTTTEATKPTIGVAWPRRDYLAALERAGARVRELQPDVDALPAALDGCDGVLLTGGVDVDPHEYGERTRHPTVEVDSARDAYELALVRSALERDLPMFAICRGVQVLNVAAGGTLIQDLPSTRPSDVPHSVTEPKTDQSHEIAIERGSCLGTLMWPRRATEPVLVNSRHHQAVKKPAPGFVVSATAPDGVIEAIEKPGARFCLGVQWHPENFWQTGEFQELFTGLVEAAKSSRGRKAIA